MKVFLFYLILIVLFITGCGGNEARIVSEDSIRINASLDPTAPNYGLGINKDISSYKYVGANNPIAEKKELEGKEVIVNDSVINYVYNNTVSTLSVIEYKDEDNAKKAYEGLSTTEITNTTGVNSSLISLGVDRLFWRSGKFIIITKGSRDFPVSILQEYLNKYPLSITKTADTSAVIQNSKNVAKISFGGGGGGGGATRVVQEEEKPVSIQNKIPPLPILPEE